MFDRLLLTRDVAAQPAAQQAPFGVVVGEPKGGQVGLFGLVGAAILVVIALAANMPALLLILVAAVGGASAIVAGIALLMGVLPLSGAEPDTLAQALSEHWWLNVAYLVLLVVGIVTQLRHRSTADLRASYR